MHQTTLLRSIRGLEGVVTVDMVDPVRREEGGGFSLEKDYLRKAYLQADRSFTGGVRVPVLWDRTAAPP